MLFWILIAVLVVISIVSAHFWANGYVRYAREFFPALAWGLVLSAIVVGLYTVITCMLMSLADANEFRVRGASELRALATGSDVNGRFFLGSGYIDGSPSFEYITQADNGEIRVDSVNTSYASVFEDEETAPYMVTIANDTVAPLWIPWPVEQYDTYVFHIPEGSVLGGYNVSVGE